MSETSIVHKTRCGAGAGEGGENCQSYGLGVLSYKSHRLQHDTGELSRHERGPPNSSCETIQAETPGQSGHLISNPAPATGCRHPPFHFYPHLADDIPIGHQRQRGRKAKAIRACDSSRPHRHPLFRPVIPN